MLHAEQVEDPVLHSRRRSCLSRVGCEWGGIPQSVRCLGEAVGYSQPPAPEVHISRNEEAEPLHVYCRLSCRWLGWACPALPAPCTSWVEDWVRGTHVLCPGCSSVSPQETVWLSQDRPLWPGPRPGYTWARSGALDRTYHCDSTTVRAIMMGGYSSGLRGTPHPAKF